MTTRGWTVVCLMALALSLAGAMGCKGGGEGAAGASGSGKAKSSGQPLDDKAAQNLYTRACMSCHGKGGQGDGHRSRMLGGLPNFTDAAFHSARTDEQIANVIKNGKGRMPAFEWRFGDHEVQAMVKMVRSFGPKTP